MPYSGQTKLVPTFAPADFVESVACKMIKMSSNASRLEDLRMLLVAQCYVEHELRRANMFALSTTAWAEQVPAFIDEEEYQAAAGAVHSALRYGVDNLASWNARTESSVVGQGPLSLLHEQWAGARELLADLFSVRLSFPPLGRLGKLTTVAARRSLTMP